MINIIKLMSNITTNIDNNLYDRQIRTYGVEAVKKMTQSSVLIYGLAKGLGTEVAKNLALGGIRNIYLYDNNLVSEQDLETGFYYSVDSIGQIRSNVLVPKIQELNPYIVVQSVEDYKQNQNVTIVINQSTDIVNQMNEYSRETNTKLVVLYSGGVSGVVFVDAGKSHIINDVSGENIDNVQIGEITSSGLVKCAPNSSHDFQSGDFVQITNLEGDNLEQINKEWKINVINKFSFQLEDFIVEPFTFINGTAIHIKKPINISHQTWQEQLIKPNIVFNFDMDNSEKLVQTYIQMYSNNLINSMPFIWDEENRIFMNEHKIVLSEYARTFNHELITVVSLMGSITASEAIKLITNKYMPIGQWFSWSDATLLPSKPEYADSKTTYGQLWGTEFENKLFNSKWFMVGSGAIGCEHLKNLAFMNIGNQDYGSGCVIVTDPDSIEKSNLNRQFLFRTHHIGKPKSEMASESIKIMKPNMNVIPLLDKVGSDNMEFTNKIMTSDLTGVLNALDNVKARRFMDEMCFKYSLPLFESGTTGTKGNTQAVIPFVTETYSNSTDPEQEKSFPICTIKSFPNEIVHTIHWAMDQFDFFNRAPMTMNKWLINPTIISGLSPVEKSIALIDINELTIKHPTQKLGWKSCAEWAVDMFVENYYNSIVQLLHTFPENHEISGVKFWSAGKRCPKPIKFNVDDINHFKYVNATTHLLTRISGLKDDFSSDELYETIKMYEPKVFIPKDIKIATKDTEIEMTTHDQEIKIGNPNEFTNIFVPQEFEKDDETNWHIEWITNASNIRAMNYNIPIASYQETKGIAGRIIPAIATTTSAVSGLILLEMLKYVKGYNKVEQYRSTFINLAETLLVYSEPMCAPMMELGGLKLNSWTKFDYKADSTLNEFKQYYEKQFETTITMIVMGTNMIYAEFFESDCLEKKLSVIFQEILDEVPSNITINFATDDDKDLPSINVIL
jgi:ubiquitin-activating enzyme E1